MAGELDEANARIDALAAEAQVIHERLERALTKRDTLIARQDQPAKDSVIKFHVQFDEPGPVYTYVAYRSFKGSWHITGKAKPMSWEDLTRFMKMDITTKAHDGEVRFFLYGAGTKSPGRWQGRKS